MTDSTTSYVSGDGPVVHTGSGPQNLSYNISLVSKAGRSPRQQGPDGLRWLARCFIHPQGFGRARAILESDGIVFLEAPPGSGRVTAAKMLLWELRLDDAKFHELLLQEQEGAPRLDRDHIGDDDQAWLDLTDIGPLWDEVRAELLDLRAAVRDHRARLVVILPNAMRGFSPELDQYRVRIEPPPAKEVLLRHLRIAGIPAPSHLPPIEFLKTNPSPERIYQYVLLVGNARERASGKGGFEAWCQAADKAISGREQDIAELLATLPTGTQRALLLTTAMLHGSHADSIYRASISLLKTVGHPAEERPLLERATLYERFSEIKAKADGSGRIEFTEPGYGSAIRRYFWTHMPELRSHMQTWVGTSIDSAGLVEDEAENLIERFTALCMDDKYWHMLRSLVEQWTGRPSPGRVKATAFVLQYGLQDERHGRVFRRQIYEWSRNSGLMRGPLAQVVVAACRDVMTVTHPDEALVRLHHVARREETAGAREALIALSGADRRFLRQMLSRLTDAPAEPRKWPADIGLFLELADPEALTDPGRHNHALIAESGVRRQLTDGWSLAFGEVSHEIWISYTEQWLSCAAHRERYRGALLDVLVDGCEQRPKALGRLYAMTRNPAFQGTISCVLLEKINAVQGIRAVRPQEWKTGMS